MRMKAFGVIQQLAQEGLSGMSLGELTLLQLEIAMLHSALAQNFAASALLERVVKQMIEAILEGARCAPKELLHQDSRILFGFHMAHLAGFVTGRIGPLSEKAAQIETALRNEGQRVPLQVALHMLLSLERLERLGTTVALRKYTATFSRIRSKLQQHKGIARALRMEGIPPEDELFLAACLTARCYLFRTQEGTKAKKLLDVGLAGAYEPREPSCPPLLGMPFGTLMLEPQG
jgi:hypothetical protein